ncbi:MAG: UDP-N-acetylmuramoyl-tripeptide--D-alanyl-D-alanine ligase, partial [Pseudobdellovibrionaceae bacterium]
ILVDETAAALQRLAKKYRQTCSGTFVGITGSNGKTSTKEFAAAIVSHQKTTHSNKGSFNNHWGVPFNLLQVDPKTEVVLVEMGMNHSREIELLVDIANPDVVVCTMVGTAHIENFGSIEKIAEAKEEIYRFASPQAKMIFNLDDSNTLRMYEKYRSQRSTTQFFTFSEKHTSADVQMNVKSMSLDQIEVSGRIVDQVFHVKLSLFGYQNMTNLMAAACIGLSVGMNPAEIVEALPNCKTTWGRNQKLVLKSGATLLFDAYNANPDSMKALLLNLEKMQHSSVIGVFGQMRELGSVSESAHFEIGKIVGSLKMKAVWFIGENEKAFRAGVLETNTELKQLYTSPSWNEDIQSQFENSIDAKDLVVMKASRGTRLEQFLSDKIIDPG